MSWQKKILRVNLTDHTCAVEPLNMEWAHDYIGERGLGSKYLVESIDPKVDPMSPNNVLIFATFCPGCSRSVHHHTITMSCGMINNQILHENCSVKARVLAHDGWSHWVALSGTGLRSEIQLMSLEKFLIFGMSTSSGSRHTKYKDFMTKL